MRLIAVVVADQCLGYLRRSQRGTITALVIGGYCTGLLAAAGALLIIGYRAGRARRAVPAGSG